MKKVFKVIGVLVLLGIVVGAQYRTDKHHGVDPWLIIRNK